MQDVKEEIVFLESEIVDDDENAPVGVLISAPTLEQNAQNETIAQDTVTPAQDTDEQPTVEDEQQQEVTVEETTTIDETIPEQITDAESAIVEDIVEKEDEQSLENEAAADIDQITETELSSSEEIEEPSTSSEVQDVKQQAQEVVLPVLEEAPAPIVEKAKPAKKTAKVASAEDFHEPVKNESVAEELASDGFDTPLTPVKKQTVKKTAPADPWTVAEVKSTNTAAKKDETVANGTPAKKSDTSKAKTTTEDKSKVAKETKTGAKTADTKKSAAGKKAVDTKKTAVAKAPAKKAEPAPKAKAEPKKAEAAAETVIIEGDTANPHGKFVIKKTDKGNFVYKLYSFNHRVVAIGAEQYGALASCKAGITSVINNAEKAPIEDQTLKKVVEQKCPKWEIYADKKGEIRLRLIASNGNIVATTNDGYLSKDAAKKGIDAIARASKGASIVRNDNLW